MAPMSIDYSRTLWSMVILFFVLGDIVSSAICFELGMVEVHPLYRWFNGFGLDVFISAGMMIKFLAVSLIFWIYKLFKRYSDDHWVKLLIPGSVALIGVFLTLHNLYCALLI